MSSGKFRYRKCDLCGIFKHPDDTHNFLPGEVHSQSRRLCWSCVEAVRELIPQIRPIDLRVIEGAGQQKLFRTALVAATRTRLTVAK